MLGRQLRVNDNENADLIAREYNERLDAYPRGILRKRCVTLTSAGPTSVRGSQFSFKNMVKRYKPLETPCLLTLRFNVHFLYILLYPLPLFDGHLVIAVKLLFIGWLSTRCSKCKPILS